MQSCAGSLGGKLPVPTRILINVSNVVRKLWFIVFAVEAGLVFAFTMMSMVVSNLVVVGQVGTTIGLGLLFDTLIIRSFMTPSIAALMGRWFWWPQRVRTRPVPSPWPKTPRHSADNTPVSVGAGDENPTGPIR